MSDRLDAMIGREYEANGEKKTAWSKIGVAFPTKNGGYRVQLEALPVPRMGQNGLETSFVLMPPRQDDRQSQPRQQSRPQSAPAFEPGGMDEGIPF
ncbi:hypothetical protein NO932_06540 [Pelagibacterium sp. 26DY04]|uniref:hypothetical protein n=1 Tax=Pelagibacterium sp. 26DY04 TaxID=2967130 RepID=UPI002815A46A|nr:hypothetical protein [Pelagibacterium sp. 26DY04]WMT88263.1 hypothetical protein NO932_06540 [Pelagibacterium sp. 26DY04]